MSKQKITLTEWLHTGLLRVSRLHFLLIAAFAIQIVVYDAWHVLAPEVVMWRWSATALLLVTVAVIWYLAHNRQNDIAAYKRLIFFTYQCRYCLCGV